MARKFSSPSEPISVSFPGDLLRGQVLLSTFCDRNSEFVDGRVELRSDEGIIIQLASEAIVPK
jgi:hypothetical protein